MARLGGFLASSAEARSASTETVFHRLWLRMPWLLVGLAGALAAAVVVGAFDRQLQEEVLIAFFVPGVVYIADAVGVQTTALVVRGLSVGVSIRRIALRESITGVLVGLLLGAAMLHRLGKDPAYGAGPLSTVIQDLLSLTIYFLTASVIVF